MNLQQQLHRLGIFHPDSEELRLYEARLSRYFSREYQQLDRDPVDIASSGIPTDLGPMWAQTGRLMDEHFDAPFSLFRAFLDHRYMAYTMAYFGENAETVKQSDATLERAQQAKLELVCQRAAVRGDERVFNIGCGFGPLETLLVEQHPGVDITSITPSLVQSDYIKRCIALPSHALHRRQLNLITGDFGALEIDRQKQHAYDLVFAIGAFEHVHNLSLAFEKINALLKPGGRLFLHLIVSRPLLPHYHDAKKTLIGRFFPGGHIWPKSLIEQQERFFNLEASWYLNGMNYWRTLQMWHLRYWQNIEQLYPGVLSVEQIRYWNDYFILCKVALFAPCGGEIYGNGQFLFRKPG